jgi:hypothetical protein
MKRPQGGFTLVLTGQPGGVASACTITQRSTNVVTSAQIIAVDVP